MDADFARTDARLNLCNYAIKFWSWIDEMQIEGQTLCHLGCEWTDLDDLCHLNQHFHYTKAYYPQTVRVTKDESHSNCFQNYVLMNSLFQSHLQKEQNRYSPIHFKSVGF